MKTYPLCYMISKLAELAGFRFFGLGCNKIKSFSTKFKESNVLCSSDRDKYFPLCNKAIWSISSSVYKTIWKWQKSTLSTSAITTTKKSPSWKFRINTIYLLSGLQWDFRIFRRNEHFPSIDCQESESSPKISNVNTGLYLNCKQH